MKGDEQRHEVLCRVRKDDIIAGLSVNHSLRDTDKEARIVMNPSTSGQRCFVHTVKSCERYVKDGEFLIPMDMFVSGKDKYSHPEQMDALMYCVERYGFNNTSEVPAELELQVFGEMVEVWGDEVRGALNNSFTFSDIDSTEEFIINVSYC